MSETATGSRIAGEWSGVVLVRISEVQQMLVSVVGLYCQD